IYILLINEEIHLYRIKRYTIRFWRWSSGSRETERERGSTVCRPYRVVEDERLYQGVSGALFPNWYCGGQHDGDCCRLDHRREDPLYGHFCQFFYRACIRSDPTIYCLFQQKCENRSIACRLDIG